MSKINMEIRKLNALYGWLWVKHGFQLIMCNPLMAITLALICTIAMFVVLNVPQIGPLIAVLLMPLLMAGYARICRALEEGEAIEPVNLFNGFQKHQGRLVALGGITLLGALLVAIPIISIGSEALVAMMENMKSTNDLQALSNALMAMGPGTAAGLMLVFALIFLLMFALQYAPMLVYFNNLTPLAALQASLVGSLRNLVPYTVYSIIMQVLAIILGVLPFGIGLILILPLGLTSLYVSYRNIFPFAGEIQGDQKSGTVNGQIPH